MAFTSLDTINSQIEAILQAYPWLYVVIIGLLVWKLVWYGLALYKSVQKEQKLWFVSLFVCAFILNDLGLLPILYLIFNRDKKMQKVQKAVLKQK